MTSLGYLAQADTAGKRKDNAIKLIDEALTLAESLRVRMTDEALRVELADMLANISFLQLLTNQSKAAADTARTGLETVPQNYRCTLNLAHALLVAGKVDEAKAMYQKLMKDPAHKDDHVAADARDDFKRLRDAGISTREMESVENLIEPTTRAGK